MYSQLNKYEIDTIICPNRACGKELSVQFTKCPFCGTSLDALTLEAREEIKAQEEKTRIRVTTTNIIEHFEIVEYLQVITSNAVVSSNIVKEFFVGFRNLVGGFSGKYKELLDSAFNTAMNLLKESAKSLNANAIIGLKVDFGSISSDSSSNMFMISLSGTAVRTRPLPNYNKLKLLLEVKTYFEQGMLSETDYQNECRKIEELYS